MTSATPLPAPAEHGWRSVPRSQEAVLKLRTNGASARTKDLENLAVPQTDLATRIREYASQELIPQTFSHSMRVYHYGKLLPQPHYDAWNSRRSLLTAHSIQGKP